MQLNYLLIKKNDKYFLIVNEEKYTISDYIVFKYKLNENIELDKDTKEKLVIDALSENAYEYSLELLRYPRSVFEVKEKLTAKGFPSFAVKYSIDKLKNYSILNDNAYAEEYIKININKIGKTQLTIRLREKGLKDEIIKEKLNLVSEEPVLRRIIPLKLKQQKGSLRVITEKILNYFSQKGYNFDLCKSILNEEFEKKPIDDILNLENDFKKLQARFIGYKTDLKKKRDFTKTLLKKGYALEEIIKLLEN